MFGEVIAISGMVETLLHNEDDPNDPENEENKNFMHQQRKKLKSITEGHVRARRYVQALVNATKSIKSDLNQGQDNDSTNAEDGEEKKNGSSSSAKDYESILLSKIEIEKHEVEKNSIAIENEEMVRKLREKLNEKIPSANRNNGGDDDEIEVEFTHNNTERALKCPITGVFFDDPVKNKVCGHVYERNAIIRHLRIKSACPVMGCSNYNVTMSQVELDEETKLKVRRLKRTLEEKRRRDLASQDYDIDDEEEEYGGGNDGNGLTVIE